MNRDLVVSLDCSTSASKAIVWDRRGRILAEGRASLPMLRPQPEWHEQPAESWWQASCEALAQATAQVNPDRLAALGITHQRETFVPVNSVGRPLRNAILWMDERARPLLPRLEREFGHGRFQAISGKPLSGNLSAAKIAWLQQNEPQVCADSFMYLDVHAFLVHRLTGNFVTGWGCADPMGLFDMSTNTWSAEIITSIGAHPEQFPTAVPPGAVVGVVGAEAARQSGLPAGLPVVAGLGDGQSAGLGTNITHPGECYLSLGTGIVSGSYADNYSISSAFRTMYGGVPGSYILETVLLGGAYTVKWFVECFTELEKTQIGMDLSAEELMDAAAQKVHPGALGLLLVPYWNSAMNPYWDASASGIVVGWRGVHGRQHLYRAILEGTAFEQRLHTQGVETSLGREIRRYIAVGGGARNPLWCQIIADVTGKQVFRSRSLEASALGAGILAAGGVGLYPDIPAAAAAMSQLEDNRFTPDPRRFAYYTRLYEDVYIHLFPALQIYLDRLTSLSADFEQFFSSEETDCDCD